MNEEDRIKVTKVEIRAVDETGKDTVRARENIGFSGLSTDGLEQFLSPLYPPRTANQKMSIKVIKEKQKQKSGVLSS